MVRIIHASNVASIPPGHSVGTVRRSLREVLNLSDEAVAFVNGEPSTAERLLSDGDHLEFVVEEGAKGVGQVWTGEEFCKLLQITPEHLEDMIARGLKVLKLADGSVRITETAADEFVRGNAIESPYLSTEEAARYCNLTKDAFYGRVERRKIKPLPGSGKENRFTREQCDQMMKGE